MLYELQIIESPATLLINTIGLAILTSFVAAIDRAIALDVNPVNETDICILNGLYRYNNLRMHHAPTETTKHFVIASQDKDGIRTNTIAP